MFRFLHTRGADPVARLRKVVGEYNLPTFPAAAMETLRLIRDPKSSASHISEVLSVDPGLSLRVLHLANSAAFSPNRHVDNLSQAVAVIGLSQLESIVLAASANRCLPRDPYPGYCMKRFWRVSVRRGVLAKEIGRALRAGEDSVCFSAGILQDMAIPFLLQQRPDDYPPVIEAWHRDAGDLAALERERFDWDHAEVATWICAAWKVPEPIAAAIGGHHGTGDAASKCPLPVRLVALIGGLSDEAQTAREMEAVTQAVAMHSDTNADDAKDTVNRALEKANQLAQLLS